MAKAKVLLLGDIEHAKTSWNAVANIADVVTTKAKNREEFLDECRKDVFEGVVAICDRAPKCMTITGRYDDELVAALPISLKFICHMGAGYDSIDISACNKRSILVSNCPGVVEDSTSDAGIFLILAALRGFNNGILAIRNGMWKGKDPPEPLGHNPQDKVLGILGMGGIGRNMKRKAESFGMKVIYHNRRPLSSDLAGGAEFVGFDGLLSQSDVLSLNLPLNPQTRNIISTAEFKKMKKGIVIVNTARGGVMDEEALVKAISAGQVRSVGLDVYQQEPNIHPDLVSNPNVCLLPHMGTFTVETKTKMEELTISNVRSAVETGRLMTIVPEQKDITSI